MTFLKHLLMKSLIESLQILNSLLFVSSITDKHLAVSAKVNKKVENYSVQRNNFLEENDHGTIALQK